VGVEDIHRLTIGAVSELLSRRELSAVEVLEATLARIAETEPVVHAYAGVMTASARADAERADRELAAGRPRSRLHGVPVAVKDVVHTRGFPTEAGSRVLAGFVPASDAKVVELLKRAGAVVVGKTVTHEFGYGQNAVPTRNAWDHARFPGGSSAGSAVAVAVGSAYGAIGTDSGGSVRIPAGLNGVVGLKPTNGRVSCEGVIPLSPTLDTVGPLARTVADCAHLLHAIVDDDPTARIGASVEGLRIGVERTYFFHDAVEDDVRAAVESATQELAEAGAVVVDVVVEDLERAVPAAWALMSVEAAEWHRELLRERGHDYVAATRAVLEAGAARPADDYVAAQRARKRVQASLARAFASYALDVLVAPSVPTTAVTVEEVAHELATGEPGAMAASLHQSVVANVAGVPALSVPCGLDSRGLPIGLQIVGRPLREDVLFQVGHAYESMNQTVMTILPRACPSPR
jgi:aspartyl-tRNA(Asn)/glutamyl-tRNA(Gln) amidotransferase subunit A